MARRGWGSIQRREGKFYGRFRLDGAPTMRLLKRPNGAACATLRQAEKSLGALRKEIEAGHTRPTRESPTFRAWCATDYLPRLAVSIAPTSLRSAGAHLERLAAWIEKHDAPRRMAELTPKHADKFVQYLVGEEGLSPAYADRLVRSLRRAWRDAAKHGVVENAAVWDTVEIRVAQTTEVPWVSPEKLVALYEATNPDQRPLVTLLGETGLRVGEALALRWDDVETGDRPAVFVREGKTRAARRKVPLSARAMAALETVGRVEGADLVFTPRSTQGVRQAVRRACQKIGIPMLKTHSLRHVAASHLVQAGVPAPTVARLLGHADHGVLVTRLYGRWMPEDAGAAAMDRLAAWRSAARPASEGTFPAGSTTHGRPSAPGVRPAYATTGGEA